MQVTVLPSVTPSYSCTGAAVLTIGFASSIKATSRVACGLSALLLALPTSLSVTLNEVAAASGPVSVPSVVMQCSAVSTQRELRSVPEQIPPEAASMRTTRVSSGVTSVPSSTSELTSPTAACSKLASEHAQAITANNTDE